MSESFVVAVSKRSADADLWLQLPELLETLGASDTSASHRVALLDALGDVIPSSALNPHIPNILASLSDVDKDVCFAAVNLLCCCVHPDAIIPHTQDLLAHFAKAPDSARWRVADVLAMLDDATLGQHASDIVGLCSSESADVRRRAVELMGSIPQQIERHDILQELLPRLQDEDEDCRLSTLELFDKVSLECLAAHLPAVAGRLEDEEGCVRMTAVGLLGRLPPGQAEPLVPLLMRCLEDDFWRVRRQAMEVLAALPAAVLAPHTQTVVARLGHKDPRIREWAIAALGTLWGTLGPQELRRTSGSAVEALRKLADDDDRRVRERAAALCKRMSDPDPTGHRRGEPDLVSTAPTILP